MTRKRRRKLTRRQFLVSGTAVGVAASIPGFLSGCGDDGESSAPTPTPAPTATPTPRPGRGPRERRTLHFDLSHNGAIRDAHLNVLNSDSYRAPLQVHTAATRQHFRQLMPALNAIPDAQLTHYVEAADLPASALQLVTVIGTTDSGAPALLGAYINIPGATLQEYAARALRGDAPMPTALLQRYGAAATAEGVGSALTCSNSLVNPFTTAVALCFHHPELMNLNPTLGTQTLMGYLQTLPATCTDPDTEPCLWVDPLAIQIANNSPATTTPGGWATLVALTDASGKPVTDQSGNQLYRYDLSDGTFTQMASPIQEVLKAVFDDMQYEGSNWNATSGQTSIDQSAATANGDLGADAQADTSLKVQSSIASGCTFNGIEFVGLTVTDQTTRQLQLAIKNRYLRWVGAFVQYYQPDGTVIPVANPRPLYDTSTSTFIRQITSNNQIMGIPLMGDAVGNTCLDFQIPETASKACVILGSLGMGGKAFCPEAVLGSAMTLTFNFGIPTILLALGIGETASAGVSALANNNQLVDAVIETLLSFLRDSAINYGAGIYGSETSKSWVCFLSAVGNSLIQALLEASPLFVQYLAIQEVGQAAAAVVPVTWIFKAVEYGATLAAIAESTYEVLHSQALTINDITLSFDITTTICRDPSYGQFPLEAQMYTVTATLNKTLPYKVSGPVASMSTGPIVATITGVPSGGTVTIEVCLTDASGCTIVATGSSGPLDATPDGAGAVTVHLTNHPVTLTKDTQYHHEYLLEYQNGARAWVPNLPAPSATVASANTLYTPSQITFSPTTLMLGYAWQTGGLGVEQCGGGSAGLLYAFQNLSAGGSPDSGLKFPGCGFIMPAGLAYDPKGPASGVGNNFFVEPAADTDNDGYYLRSVVLDTMTGFNLNQGMNWGRFTLPLDSVVVHPTGYVVGVSRAKHKLEILEVPDQAVSDATPASSPWATMHAGYGTRAGLLDTPVAVAVHEGAILILEQGNLRIQAFDLAGNPATNYFGGTTSPSPFAALMIESQAVIYVDLASDAVGYLFVLSYVGDGTSPTDYRLDVYDADGNFLTRTTGVPAGRMTVDPLRTVYTVNYAALAGAPRVEPSLSQWLPFTPDTMSTCGQTPT